MTYIGIPALRETVERWYGKVKHLYVRENPTIVVGAVTSKVVNGETVLKADRERNKQVHEAVTALMQLYGTNMSCGRGEKNLRKKLAIIKDYVDDTIPGDADACYRVNYDAVFMRPRHVFDLLTSRIARQRSDLEHFAQTLETRKFIFMHELVHWDLGDTLPDQDIRRIWRLVEQQCPQIFSCESPSARQQGATYHSVSIATLAKLRNSIETARGKLSEDQLTLCNILADNNESMAATCVNVLNEAVAYAAMGEVDFSTVGDALKDESFELFYALYAHFREQFTSIGQKEAIARAKQVINESWMSKRSVADVLGIRV